MNLTPEQQEPLELAAKRLMDWLVKSCHPHTKVIVESDRAELLECITLAAIGLDY